MACAALWVPDPSDPTGRTGKWVSIQGEQGPKGDPGADGQNGLDGKDGINGIDGKDGKPGTFTIKGEIADSSLLPPIGSAIHGDAWLASDTGDLWMAITDTTTGLLAWKNVGRLRGE